MQTIGERLEEARKRKGISIREAAEATKIRSDYLHKFESNSFDLNLPEIYVRGFLRGYANYLELNSEKLLADYRTLAPGEDRASRRENREVYGRMDLGQSARPAPETPPAPPAEETSAPKPPPRPGFTAAIGGSGPIDRALLVKVGIVAAALVFIVVIVFGIRALSSGPAKATSGLKPAAQQTLTITATGPVDVQVKQELDDQIIWRAHMRANESHTLTKRGGLYLTAKPMQNIQIEVDGQRLRNPYTGLYKVLIE